LPVRHRPAHRLRHRQVRRHHQLPQAGHPRADAPREHGSAALRPVRRLTHACASARERPCGRRRVDVWVRLPPSSARRVGGWAMPAYRLQTLLEIRERAEEAAKQAFAEAMQALAKQREQLKKMELDLERRRRERKAKIAAYMQEVM